MNKLTKQTRGRPRTGPAPKIDVRIPLTLLAKIDDYADRDFRRRSEAIRALLEKGLQRCEA